jgi:hypothetical protein
VDGLQSIQNENTGRQFNDVPILMVNGKIIFVKLKFAGQ